MSLRLKLIALFTMLLAATMGVAAWLGGRLAATTVETEIRERALETARAAAAELARAASYDPRATAERLAELLRAGQGIRSVELGVERPGADAVTRAEMSAHGVTSRTREETVEIPARPEARLVEAVDGRAWSVSVPARVGRSRARLTLEASLAEADRLAESERRVFVVVTASAFLVLIVASQILLGRFIGRPVEALAHAMREAEQNRLETRVPESSGDELGQLARGFNAMLVRIQGFSDELRTRVAEATADARLQNARLAEANDLLVAVRRDLSAKERLAALGQLSGTLAHELGNPLNVIHGNLQLLARDPALPRAMAEELKLLQDEVKRMTGIIRRFLDSSRGMKPVKESVEIASLVGEAVDLSLSHEMRGRIAVTVEVPESIGRVQTDPGLVRHVLANFVTNAIDAMPQGGALRVWARQQGEELRLSVSDTGPGIPESDRAHLFEPFFTTKPAGQGTGLGLSICREIALALRGHVELESAPGQGATFTLRIPAERA